NRQQDRQGTAGRMDDWGWIAAHVQQSTALPCQIRTAISQDAGSGWKILSQARIEGAEMIRILLAEDDTSMREYLQRALQRVGYEVESVGCGTEAMPLLEAGKYDLLLTDIVMPE